ncbi:unnamed protein product, partial [Mesorhabditis belari]|uniref:Uncharacterized protein n=1 Tax=Mesorhabditis belari TaxID=2138241 RepID=A0AAF3FTB9_9BILA
MNFFFISFLVGSSLSITCYYDSNDGQSHGNQERLISCGNCNFCAKAYGTLKGADKKGSLWGCGCGGNVYDIATPFGYTCTKSGKTSATDAFGDKGTIYCCDNDQCNSAKQIFSFIIPALVIVLSIFVNRLRSKEILMIEC